MRARGVDRVVCVVATRRDVAVDEGRRVVVASARE
jgi:hypothetical protein